jgi:hypothetical protein
LTSRTLDMFEASYTQPVCKRSCEGATIVSEASRYIDDVRNCADARYRRSCCCRCRSMTRPAVNQSRMTEDNRQEQSEVDRFIMDRIDTVPHLEALLLIWRDQTQASSVERLAKQLWVKPDIAKSILQDLARDGFLDTRKESGEYRYRSDPAHDGLIDLLNDVYQKELIRVSTMIHSKPSAAVREFARAFRLKKEE